MTTVRSATGVAGFRGVFFENGEVSAEPRQQLAGFRGHLRFGGKDSAEPRHVRLPDQPEPPKGRSAA
jgi:hypothetical protein